MSKGFEIIIGGSYRVDSRKGFHNALYQEIGCKEENTSTNYSKADLREAAEAYPKKYPALVVFENNMSSTGKILVKISHNKQDKLSTLKALMAANGADELKRNKRNIIIA